MSAKSKGTPSSSSPAEGPPAASKTKVKEQIKIIVEDLELVLGDLKDVAKELKEVRGAGWADSGAFGRRVQVPLGSGLPGSKLLGNYGAVPAEGPLAPATPEKSCCTFFSFLFNQ